MRRMGIFCCSAVLLLSSFGDRKSRAAAQQLQPAQTALSTQAVEVWDDDLIAEHRLTPIQPLRTAHLTLPRFRDADGIEQLDDFWPPALIVQVTINEQGNVISANRVQPIACFICEFRTPVSSDELYSAAFAQALAWKYRPFYRDGKPIPATLQEAIQVFPAERTPQKHVPFPPVINLDSVKIILQRRVDPSHESPMQYRVEIHGDGTVLYTGGSECYHDYVTADLPNVFMIFDGVLLHGTHRDHISREAVLQLLEAFRASGFLSFEDLYSDLPKPAAPDSYIAISYDGHLKELTEIAGNRVGMPEAVTELENTIDRLAETAKWVSGNADTVPSLQREGWDFSSAEASRTVALAAEYKRFHPLVPPLIVAGARPRRLNYIRDCTIERALDDLPLLDLLIRSGARDRECLNQALLRAALNGNAPAVRYLLDYGASIKTVWRIDGMRGETVLMDAVKSGDPQTVAEVLKQNPDVNARDDFDLTALFYATCRTHVYKTSDEKLRAEQGKAEIARMLLDAGADLSHRSKAGFTALHYADIPGTVRVLIERGADVNARGKDGATPLMVADSPDVARLLIESGADLYARDREGHSVLDCARKFPHYSEQNMVHFAYWRERSLAARKTLEVVQAALQSANAKAGAPKGRNVAVVK